MDFSLAFGGLRVWVCLDSVLVLVRCVSGVSCWFLGFDALAVLWLLWWLLLVWRGISVVCVGWFWFCF